MNNIIFSVIIATKDRERLCNRLLLTVSKSLQEGNLAGSTEIIIVDDGSAKKGSYSSNPKPTVLRNDASKGASHARNLGAAQARGRYLVFLDDDTTVPKGYFNDLNRIILENRPDILGCRILPGKNDVPTTFFAMFLSTGRKMGHMPGANLTIKKELFDRQGFDVDVRHVEDYKYFHDVDRYRPKKLYSRRLYVRHTAVGWCELLRKIKNYSRSYARLHTDGRKQIRISVIDLDDGMGSKKRYKYLTITQKVGLCTLLTITAAIFLTYNHTRHDLQLVKKMWKAVKR